VGPKFGFSVLWKTVLNLPEIEMSFLGESSTETVNCTDWNVTLRWKYVLRDKSAEKKDWFGVMSELFLVRNGFMIMRNGFNRQANYRCWRQNGLCCNIWAACRLMMTLLKRNSWEHLHIFLTTELSPPVRHCHSNTTIPNTSIYNPLQNQ